jgi:hypothetical protein
MMDIFNILQLSEDVIFNILTFLEYSDLCALAICNKFFNRISTDPKLWERLYNKIPHWNKISNPILYDQ